MKMTSNKSTYRHINEQLNGVHVIPSRQSTKDVVADLALGALTTTDHGKYM